MSWLNRLAGLMRPKKLDVELDDAVQFHIESRVRQDVAEGMTRGEARGRARLGFGARDRIKEVCREADGVQWLDTAWRDPRYALRSARARCSQAHAVLSLALGIGSAPRHHP